MYPPEPTTCLKTRVFRLARRKLRRAKPRDINGGHLKVYLPRTYSEALKRMQVHEFDMKTNTKIIASHDYKRLHPEMVDFVRKLTRELNKQKLPFYIHSTWRTHAEQLALLKRGVTRAGPGDSPHNFGCALDLVHVHRHWDISRKEWAMIGAIGREVARKANVQVMWGGDWNFYDPAHWELKRWKLYRSAHNLLAPVWSREGVDPSALSADEYYGQLDREISKWK